VPATRVSTLQSSSKVQKIYMNQIDFHQKGNCVITVHGDAAFHGVAMAQEDQSFRTSTRRKPSACKKLHPSRIPYIFLKDVEKKKKKKNPR